MIIFIDASNINSGGGVTHLTELLRATNLSDYGFDKAIIWAPQKTLNEIENKPWLIKKTDPILDKSYLHRALWQYQKIDKLARSESCDLVFVPGGTFVCKFRPVVTMSQNLLPFEFKELSRYGFSPLGFKFFFLRFTQSLSFRKADGVIFLTEFARNSVIYITGKLNGVTTIIPHGIDNRFFLKPRKQYSIEHYSFDNPFRILYVSTIEPYKHQWHVVNAIAKLRAKGFPVVLDLIGGAYPPALHRLQKMIKKVDAERTFINYLGLVPHSELQLNYRNANLNVFASSCETFGQILLEGMASGLPTACSHLSAMPEILGDAGVYFDPENYINIANVIEDFISSADSMEIKAEAAYQKAIGYSWEKCAAQTFSFLATIAKKEHY